jgi:hypothetical protein
MQKHTMDAYFLTFAALSMNITQLQNTLHHLPKTIPFLPKA